AAAPVCIAALSTIAHAQRCGEDLVSPSISLPNPTSQYRFENAALSADGRFVAYHSMNGSLVAGDTNGVCDVFVYDRANGTTERVSVASDGSQIPANGNGWVAMYP